MNAKLAKTLRQLSGYKNQTRTPGRMEFPGVAGFYAMPTFEKHLVQKYRRGFIYDVEQGHYVWADVCYTEEVFVRPLKPLLSSDGKPVTTPEPKTRPGRLNMKDAKQVYRAAKRAVGRLGTREFFKQLREHATAEAAKAA